MQNLKAQQIQSMEMQYTLNSNGDLKKWDNMTKQIDNLMKKIN